MARLLLSFKVTRRAGTRELGGPKIPMAAFRLGRQTLELVGENQKDVDPLPASFWEAPSPLLDHLHSCRIGLSLQTTGIKGTVFDTHRRSNLFHHLIPLKRVSALNTKHS